MYLLHATQLSFIAYCYNFKCDYSLIFLYNNLLLLVLVIVLYNSNIVYQTFILTGCCEDL